MGNTQKDYRELGDRINPLELEEEIDLRRKSLLSIKNYECEKLEQVRNQILEKYMAILDPEFLKSKITEMIATEQSSIHLLYDEITEDKPGIENFDRKVDRNQLMSINLDIMIQEKDRYKYPHIRYWNTNIIDTLRRILPYDYSIYYHFIVVERIYTIKIYQGNSIINNPVCCCLFCCVPCF